MKEEIKITREMLVKGYEQGLVNIVKKGDCIVCEIGDNWFYFAGMELENFSIENFLSITETDDNLNSIYRTLEDFRTDEIFQDEYKYYYYYLVENLK